MSNCKACGVPPQIIKVNRQLNAKNNKLAEQVKQLKAERSSLKKELRSTKRNLENAKITTENYRMDLNLTKVELKASFTARLDLEAKLNATIHDARSNRQKAERLAEKMKHIKDLAARPDEWLRIGCRNG